MRRNLQLNRGRPIAFRIDSLPSTETHYTIDTSMAVEWALFFLYRAHYKVLLCYRY